MLLRLIKQRDILVFLGHLFWHQGDFFYPEIILSNVTLTKLSPNNWKTGVYSRLCEAHMLLFHSAAEFVIKQCQTNLQQKKYIHFPLSFNEPVLYKKKCLYVILSIFQFQRWEWRTPDLLQNIPNDCCAFCWHHWEGFLTSQCSWIAEISRPEMCSSILKSSNQKPQESY